MNKPANEHIFFIILFGRLTPTNIYIHTYRESPNLGQLMKIVAVYASLVILKDGWGVGRAVICLNDQA